MYVSPKRLNDTSPGCRVVGLEEAPEMMGLLANIGWRAWKKGEVITIKVILVPPCQVMQFALLYCIMQLQKILLAYKVLKRTSWNGEDCTCQACDLCLLKLI